jgi:hypothetical protein
MEIQVVDNFLSDQIHKDVFERCLNSLYTYGETDNDDTPPTGMVSNIGDWNYIDDSYMWDIFSDRISNKFPETSNKLIYRMYINCFSPSENPYFHTDGPKGEITFLYYPHIHWNYDDGGETQFIMNNEITAISPIPNRMVKFNAELLHKATSFRNNHRFTIAVKYK